MSSVISSYDLRRCRRKAFFLYAVKVIDLNDVGINITDNFYEKIIVIIKVHVLSFSTIRHRMIQCYSFLSAIDGILSIFRLLILFWGPCKLSAVEITGSVHFIIMIIVTSGSIRYGVFICKLVVISSFINAFCV